MRIGVDACCWANGRGYGRFTRELLRALVDVARDDTFVFLLDDAAASGFDLSAANVDVMRVAQGASPTKAAAANGYRAPTDMLRMTRAAAGAGADVFFSPSVYTYFPLPPRQRTVVTIHDVIPERFPQLTLPSRRARLFWKAKVSLALLQARLVVTVSDYAAREISEVHGIDASRIRVVGGAPAAVYGPSEPARIAAAAERAGLDAGAGWFTYVGGFNPHKRVEAAVRAHAVLAAELGERTPHLLLIGAQSDVFHDSVARVREEIALCGTERFVHWLGFVADDELRHLHAGARALVLPSAAEGLGLPAVEAAACGTPVIATTASPLPQLLEGGGFFVDPGDDVGLAAAMRTLATDDSLRADLGERARMRAALLTWERAAQQALAVLREAAA
jgi:alpha-1,3-rhamnosyl/mannosyltransferase